MALFQRKPQETSIPPLYSVGQNKTVLVVGLGNPGKEYDKTRHNIGFEAVDAFVNASKLGDWVTKKDLKCHQASGTLGESRVIVVKPTTFMNLSGEAIQLVINFYKIPLTHVIVVHDELDIPFGQIRMRIGGSSAGHNGIKSLIEHCGQEFGRVRIGVSNDVSGRAESSDFVLGKFNKTEQEQIPNLLRETSAILSEYVYGNPLAPETRTFIV